jgi:hypothetical protein
MITREDRSVKVRVFGKSDMEAYGAFVKYYQLSLDICYDIRYLLTDAEAVNGEVEIFTVSDPNSVFIYPYIKLPLAGEFEKYSDITSPYGYCGPFCNNASFFDQAESSFIEYASGRHIVTEFVRYHFLYNSELKFRQNIDNVKNRIMITLDLNPDWEFIWMREMSGTNRNIVRKLEKEGFDFEISEKPDDLELFVDMYNETMKQANAGDFYYFPNSYYQKLFDQVPGKIRLARVSKNGICYASALFFDSGKIFTYYLSSRNFNYQHIPASNFMLTKAILYAKNKGCRWFNIGGGIANSSQDPLFRFKANFSKNQIDYYIGKRIHNVSVYECMIERWIAEYGRESYDMKKHVLQFYRNSA